jgi:hypothetical protein
MGPARTWTDQQLQAAWAAPTLAQVVRRLGLVPSASSYHRVRTHAARLGLDPGRFTFGDYQAVCRYGGCGRPTLYSGLCSGHVTQLRTKGYLTPLQPGQGRRRRVYPSW